MIQTYVSSNTITISRMVISKCDDDDDDDDDDIYIYI